MRGRINIMAKIRASYLVSRVVIIEDNKVLLVKHEEDGKEAWIFPGGRVEENESVSMAAIRECKEETGYNIKLNGVCYIQEYDIFYVTYFYSTIIGGELVIGKDPELSDDEQILKDVKWIDIDKLADFDVYPRKLADRISSGRLFDNIIPIPETLF